MFHQPGGVKRELMILHSKHRGGFDQARFDAVSYRKNFCDLTLAIWMASAMHDQVETTCDSRSYKVSADIFTS